MTRVILLNKPHGVQSQFTGSEGIRTLRQYVDVPGVYPAGRLDADSEGLLLLTDDGALQARIADPKHKLPKTYLAQVEGEPTDEAIRRLRSGVELGDFKSRPAEARVTPEPDWLWPRDPPVRYRRHIPTTWIELVLREGRNRQVRRMTAAVGFPTLRLIRTAIGPYSLDGLPPGRWRETTERPQQPRNEKPAERRASLRRPGP